MRTQKERILDYIEQFGSITPKEAWDELDISKLSTRVGEMIRDGVPIEKKEIVVKRPGGERTRYMAYSFKKEAKRA